MADGIDMSGMMDEIDEDGIPVGMYPKYTVYRNSEGRPPIQPLFEIRDVFVLAPSKDYHARVALAAYIESVRYFNESLANDLEEFLEFTMPEEGVEGLKMRPD
jgi:hypothetical protein